MIIKGLASLIYGVLSVLLVFELPALPADVTAYLNQAFGYIADTPWFLSLFIPSGVVKYLGVLLGLVLALNGLWLTYSLVMWIVRKIPMLNVKE